MKLTKSKQFLADAIHAKGGWWYNADFAVQDKDMWICLYEGKPTRRGDNWRDDGDCMYKLGFSHDKLSPNWRQTVLSREEYFSAYPAEPVADDDDDDDDGWIEWKSKFYGDMPVPAGTEVDILMDGSVYHRYVAEVWKHWGTTTKYRLYKPEVKSTAVGDDETNLATKEGLDALEYCESVTRSIPEPSAKPTIEQLAADHRKANDYAWRKQQEADAAKASAEAKLALLVEAGKAHGLVVSPTTEKQDPELVITDWRDLQVGDEVECIKVNITGDGYADHLVGCRGTVIDIEPPMKACQPIRVDFSGGDVFWISEWKFIRRP